MLVLRGAAGIGKTALVPLLLDAAGRLESLDPGRARETYLEALRAASVAGRLGSSMRSAATAARAAPPRPGPSRASDLLLDGLAIRFTEGYVASAPALKRALGAVREEGGRSGLDVRWPWTARRVAPDLFDDEMWHALATRNVQIARDAGALGVLPLALNALSMLRCFEGDLVAAGALIGEADEIADATGASPLGFGRVLLAGCLGDEREGLATIEASEADATARSEGVVLTFGEHARALIGNGLGRHDAALAPAQSASDKDELMLSVWSLPELVEAAARCGRTELAIDAVERLARRTRAAGTELARGIEARARALVSDGPSAEELYREAVAQPRLATRTVRLADASAPARDRHSADERRPDPSRDDGAERRLRGASLMAVSATAMTTSQSIDACRRRRDRRLRNRATGAGDTRRDRLAGAAERELVLAAKHGGGAEREELVEAFMPLIGSVARIYRSRAEVDRTELMQEGVVGLLRALERFDPQIGTPFWMYASWWVRQAMQQLVSELGRPIVMSDRALRKIARIKDARREHLQRHGREPSPSAIAETIGLSRAQVESLMAAERSPRSLEEPVGGDHDGGITLAEMLDDRTASEAFDRIPLEIEFEQLPRVLAVLDERERTIICARFGFDQRQSTLRELGEQLGVSAERVRQIEAVSLGKLREIML